MGALKRWLADIRWRLARYNAYHNCIAAKRHQEVETEVPNRKGGTAVRCSWCPACSHVTWLD